MLLMFPSAHADKFEIFECTSANGVVRFSTECKEGETQKRESKDEIPMESVKDRTSPTVQQPISSKMCEKLYADAKESETCRKVLDEEKMTYDSAGLTEIYFRDKKRILAACEPIPACGDGHYDVHSSSIWAGIPISPGSYILRTITGRKCRFIRGTTNWQRCEDFSSSFLQ